MVCCVHRSSSSCRRSRQRACRSVRFALRINSIFCGESRSRRSYSPPQTVFFPHFARGFLLRQSVLINQTLEAIGFPRKTRSRLCKFSGECNRRGIFVIRRNQQTRYIVKPRNTRSAQPSLPCHKLVTASGCTPYGQRIEYAILPDALCQLRDCLRIKSISSADWDCAQSHFTRIRRSVRSLFAGNQC